MQFSYAGRGAIWVILYLFFVLGPLFCAGGGAAAGARFLDGILGRNRLRRPGDDGP